MIAVYNIQVLLVFAKFSDVIAKVHCTMCHIVLVLLLVTSSGLIL